jgi:Amino acid permease
MASKDMSDLEGISNVDIKAVVDFDNEDELRLAALGKKQIMKRNFNIWSLIFMSFCTSVTWEALCSTMAQALLAGGSSSMVFGFLASALGSTFIALSIGEFASIVPTSGGQYHYVAELAPPKYRRILSFYAAWITVYGWIISTASGTFANAMQLQAYVILFVPDYVYERWHTSLVSTFLLSNLSLVRALILLTDSDGYCNFQFPYRDIRDQNSCTSSMDGNTVPRLWLHCHHRLPSDQSPSKEYREVRLHRHYQLERMGSSWGMFACRYVSKHGVLLMIYSRSAGQLDFLAALSVSWGGIRPLTWRKK